MITNFRVEKSGGDFASIGEALIAGHRVKGQVVITLGGGSYEEVLEFESPKFTFLAGPDCTPVLIGRDQGVLISESVRFVGIRFAAPHSHIPAVTVVSKSPQFERCTIEHLRVDLKGTPIVTSSTFSGSSTTGLSFAGVSGGLIDSCTFLSNRLYGILVEGSASPTIRGCSLTMSGRGAVVLCGQSRALLVDCNVQDSTGLGDARPPGATKLSGSTCDRAGIAVGNVATPTIRGNTIFSCSGHGIAVFGAAFSPMKISEKSPNVKRIHELQKAVSTTTIEGNTIRSNNGLGIFVAASVPFLSLKGNSITENTMGGALFASFTGFTLVELKEGPPSIVSRCEVLNCNLADNLKFGVCVSGQGTRMEVANSKVEGHPDGVRCLDRCTATIRNCRIQRCEVAINCSRYAQVSVASSTVFDNQTGIVAESYADAACTDVIFEANTKGLAIMNSGVGNITKCNFVKNGTGVCGSLKGAGQVRGCSFSDCDVACVVSSTRARIHYSDNVFSGVSHLVVSKSGCRGYFEGNTLNVNGPCGVSIMEGGDPTLTNNVFCLSPPTSCGVELHTSSYGILSLNNFAGGRVAVRGLSGSHTAIRGNSISGSDTGMELLPGSLCTADKNAIKNVRVGFVVQGGAVGLPSLAANELSSCFVGISISGGSAERWSKVHLNSLIECGTGIDCSDSFSMITRNHCEECSLGAVVRGRGNPKFFGCTFTRCTDGGLSIQSNARCIINGCQFLANVGAATRGVRGRYGLSLEGECHALISDCVFGFNDVGLFQQDATSKVGSIIARCVFRRNYRGFVAEGSAEQLCSSSTDRGVTLIGCSFIGDIRGVLAGEGAALSLSGCLFQHCGMGLSAPVYSASVAVHASGCMFAANRLHISGMCTSKFIATHKQTLDCISADEVSQVKGIVAKECVFYRGVDDTMSVELPILFLRCLFVGVGVAVLSGAPIFAMCSFVGDARPLDASLRCVGRQHVHYILPEVEGDSSYRRRLLSQFQDSSRSVHIQGEMFDASHPQVAVSCSGASSPWLVCCSVSFYSLGLALSRTGACVVACGFSHTTTAIEIDDGFEGRVLNTRCVENYGPGISVKGRMSPHHRQENLAPFRGDVPSPSETSTLIRQAMQLCGKDSGRSCLFRVTVIRSLLAPFTPGVHVQKLEREAAFTGTEVNPTDAKDSHTPAMVVCQSADDGGVGVLVHGCGSLHCEELTIAECDIAGIMFGGSRGQLGKRHQIMNSTVSSCPFGIVLRPLVEGVDLQLCVVHSCGASGISAEQGSRITTSKCVISGCRIGVSGAGDRSEITHTLLLKNSVCGLRFGSGSKATVMDCDVVENGNGVETYQASTVPFIQKCRLHSNSHTGVLASGDAAPTIEECHIFHHHDQSGILVRCGASPTIKNNVIESNSAGIVCRLTANPTVVGNTITNNRIGLLLEWFGRGSWNLNLFNANTNNSIVCRTGGDALVCRNLFLEDAPILVTMEGRGCFALNTIRAPKQQCIIVTRGGSPTILRTCFIGSQNHDLLPWGSLAEEVDDGELLLQKCQKTAFVLQEAADKLLRHPLESVDDSVWRQLPEECESRPAQPLIEVQEGGRGIIADCVFVSAACALLVHGPSSSPTVDTCIFFQCDVGVFCMEGSLLECLSSAFELCKTAVLSTAASPAVRECIFDVNTSALVAVGVGKPSIRGSSIRRCKVGVQLGPSSPAHIHSSTFNNCCAGIVAQIGSTPNIEECKLYDSRVAGVISDTMAASLFSNSTISSAPLGMAVNGSKFCESTISSVTFVQCHVGLKVTCTQQDEEAGMEYSWTMVREGLTDELEGAVRKKAGHHHEPLRVQSSLVNKCAFLNCDTGAMFAGDSCRPVVEVLEVVGGLVGVLVISGAPTIRTSTVVNCKTGVHINGESTATIDSCTVAECSVGVVVTLGSPTILGSTISNSKEKGLLLGQDARGRVEQCEVINSGVSDIICECGSQVELGDNRVRCHGRPDVCVQIDPSSAIVGELRIEHCSAGVLASTAHEGAISTANETSAQSLIDGAASEALVAQRMREHFQMLGVGTSERPSMRSLYEAMCVALNSISEGTGEGYGFYMLTPRARGALGHLTSLSATTDLQQYLFRTALSEFITGTQASNRCLTRFSNELCTPDDEFSASCGKATAGSNPDLQYSIRDVPWEAYPPKERWEAERTEGALTVLDRLRIRTGDANPRRRMYAATLADNSIDPHPLQPSPPRDRQQVPYPRAHVQGLSSRHSATAFSGSTCLVPTVPSALSSQCLQGMQVGLHGYGHSMKESLASAQEMLGTFSAAQIFQEFSTVDARKRQTITFADLSRYIQRIVSQHSVDNTLDGGALMTGPVPSWAADVAGEAFKSCNKDPYSDELTLVEFGRFISAPSRWRALLDEHFPWLRVSNQDSVLRDQVY